MAIGSEAKTEFENPLIPNARLRQIYLAMVRARLLGKALAKRRRDESSLGLEACLVSTAVDLGPADFISDAVAGGTIDFLRGSKFAYKAGGTTQTLHRASLESVLRPGEKAGRGGLMADCGAPSRLPAMSEPEVRLWSAMGAALTLKAQHAYREAYPSVDAAEQAGVIVVCARPGEGSPVLWRKVLAFAAEQLLPVLFVVLPAAQRKGVKSSSGTICAAARQHGIPGMAVDADDAVAIYRVAQEAIGRARIGGGAALMECVPFVLEGSKGKHDASSDALAVLARYMLGRGVVTERWMEREAAACAKRIAK